MKKWMVLKIIFVFILFSFAFPAVAQNITDWSLSPNEMAVIDLDRMADKIAAVQTDILLYEGWKYDDKEGYREEITSAVKKMGKLVDEVKKLELPAEFEPARAGMISYASVLRKTYPGMETKKKEVIDSEMEEFVKESEKYTVPVMALGEKYIKIPSMPSGYIPLAETLVYIKDKKDREIFEKAVKLMSKRKFKEAKNLMQSMLVKYGNTPVEGCLISLMVDCNNLEDTDVKPGEEVMKSDVKIMEDFLDKDIYSPLIYRLFAQWQTLFQMDGPGMSNMSVILNDMYTEKRYKQVLKIKKHLETDRTDKWAKLQAIYLLDFPTIERGGMMGNTNLAIWWNLFMDKSNKKK